MPLHSRHQQGPKQVQRKPSTLNDVGPTLTKSYKRIICTMINGTNEMQRHSSKAQFFVQHEMSSKLDTHVVHLSHGSSFTTMEFAILMGRPPPVDPEIVQLFKPREAPPASLQGWETSQKSLWQWLAPTAVVRCCQFQDIQTVWQILARQVWAPDASSKRSHLPSWSCLPSAMADDPVASWQLTPAHSPRRCSSGRRSERLRGHW